MAASTSGMVLGLMAFLSTAALAQAPPSVASTLRRAHAAYVEGRAARDVPRLAIVDGDLRALMAAQRLVSVYQLRTGYKELGLRPTLFEPDYVTYTGKVLRDAHAIDPDSPARPFTLFALVFPDGEDGYELPDAAAGRAYLREFPDGPFAAETHVALARLYFDLFQVLSANEQDAAGKRECFQRYLTTAPPAAQRAAAQRHGLAHYQNAVALRPRDRQLRSEMQALPAHQRADTTAATDPPAVVASRAMTQPLSRRELLATAGAGLAIAATAGQRSAQAEALIGGIKITMPVGELTDETLAFVAYLGVDYVTTGGPASPTYTPEGRVVQARPNDPAPPWKDADLRRMKETVERAGLKLGNVMLHDFRRAILGRPGGDEDIELVKESIRAAGRVGIPIVEYNWYALRAMGGYYEEPGRGGSRLAAHDYARSKDLPALDDVGTHTAADLWTRYERFLEAVVPVAEQANVRLAVHPNDPPPPRYRGIEQILGSVDGLKRVCETVKSPANGITLDVGVTREMGADVIETIRWFGGRDQINHVHFRNVVMQVPRERYVETFIDAGDNDMLACLRALHATGYPRLLHPDHVPTLPGDAARRGGFGYAIGQMKAMLRQVSAR